MSEQGIEAEVSSRALGFAAQAWCEEEASRKIMDPVLATAVAKIIDPLLDTIEYAWTIIANAGHGDWSKESADWVKAAEKFRDEDFYRILDGRLPEKTKMVEETNPEKVKM
jgi:hypothetical protein